MSLKPITKWVAWLVVAFVVIYFGYGILIALGPRM